MKGFHFRVVLSPSQARMEIYHLEGGAGCGQSVQESDPSHLVCKVIQENYSSQVATLCQGVREVVREAHTSDFYGL